MLAWRYRVWKKDTFVAAAKMPKHRMLSDRIAFPEYSRK